MNDRPRRVPIRMLLARCALAITGLAAIVGSGITGTDPVSLQPKGCKAEAQLVIPDQAKLGDGAPYETIHEVTAADASSLTLRAVIQEPGDTPSVGEQIADYSRLANVTWERLDPSTGSWNAVLVNSNAGQMTEIPPLTLDNLVYGRDNGAQLRVRTTQRCSVVVNSLPNVSRVSDVVTLTVTPGDTAWADAGLPADASADEGAIAEFAGLAHGDNTYQWQVSADEGTTWSDVPNATGSTLRVQALANGLLYRLRATNRASSASILSRAARLTVRSVVVAPAIAQQPADVTVAVGDSASFAVSASGGALAYQWQRADGGGAYADIDGATGSVYALFATLADDGAHYRVRVGNTAGTVTSSPATLSVIQPGRPEITQQPVAQTVDDGATATFTVVASGPSLTYQWQRSDDGGTTFVDVGGANGATYSLVARAPGDAGARFRVTVANGVGAVTSLEALLTVQLIPPTITEDPQDLAVASGANALFSVGAAGSLLSYQWQTCNADGSFADIAGATGSSYGFTAVLADSGRRFRVAVTGGTTTIQSACATLTVSGTGLAVTATPSSLVAVIGTTATVNLRIHPISGQTDSVTLAARNVPTGSFAPTFTPALPLSFATTGTSDIAQAVELLMGSTPTIYTMRFEASEGGTTVAAPVHVTTLQAAAAYVQVGTSAQTTTSTLERLGAPVAPPTVPPTYTYVGRVDVGRGEFGASLTSAARTSVYAGTSRPIILVNDTSAPVDVPGDAVRFEVQGAYQFVTNGTLQVTAQLAVDLLHGPNAVGQIYGAVLHSLTGTGGAAPTVRQSTTAPGVPAVSADVRLGDRTGLRVSLRMPPITLAPGDRLQLAPAILASLATGGSALDFATTPGRLCVNLPAGITLADNAAVPTAWRCP